ncbi:hypothetical protein BV22DRAFT_1134256 [Leucogyrophana mollusca]|uniref:Uncharacterized protein n=1 Tax=Leucogyrophana mollusca TaxID=85980 RepID=A0ACB8B050_9AGAM|nr:hypothetical protein BV22DRAFT_1134256 [Leucogyrophana mollusca]
MSEPSSAGNQLVRYLNGKINIYACAIPDTHPADGNKVAGLVLLTHEYFITLGSEVRWVWGRKWWEFSRLAFTCTRYMTFVGAGMTVYAALASRTARKCVPFASASNAIHIISIISAEGLLILRTYAFWQRSKLMLISVIIFGAGCIASAITMTIFVEIPAIPEPPIDVPPGACVFQTRRSSSFQYVWLVVFELGLLGLTIFKRFRHYRYSASPLIAVLYRDGVCYMVTITATSFLNIMVTLFAPPSYNEVLDTLQLALHSVLASRILFNLRESSILHHPLKDYVTEKVHPQTLAAATGPPHYPHALGLWNRG